MNYGGPPQLLDCRDVAVGGKSWQTVRMDTPLAPLSRPDTAFWLFRAHWTEALSLNRVSTPEGASELCTGLSRDLDRDALQAGVSTETPEQGTGNG